MNYGLWLSASGMQTNTWRQDVLANNLANATTVGCKRDLAELRQRNPESMEVPADVAASNWMLDKLGGGVLAGPQSISFAPGPMQRTNVPTDIALDQHDTFLAVETPDPQTGGNAVRLTRDGRLMRNAAGDLVTAAGHRVLDDADEPIRIEDTAPITILPDGTIMQNDEPVAQLQITGVTDLNLLVKEGGNLFAFDRPGDFRQAAPNATVRPEHLEASTVDPIKALMDLVAATKAITSNGNLIRYHDLLLDRAVNVLGRVA